MSTTARAELLLLDSRDPDDTAGSAASRSVVRSETVVVETSSVAPGSVVALGSVRSVESATVLTLP